jgi:sugar phosphate isomerase/epimerase
MASATFGYQAVYDADFVDAVQYAATNRFDCVSFDLSVPRFYIDRMERDELQRIRCAAERAGVGLAFHLPGDNVSLFADYPAIRKGILEHFSAILSTAEQLGARHVVVHPGICPSFKQANKKEDDFTREYHDYFSTVLCENLLHLASQTRNVLLCVENVRFTALTRGVVERLLADTDKLFLTWDIAKTYDADLQLDAAVEEFMWQHAARIREVHAHDITPGFKSHQVIGDGGIDFRKYAALFRRADVAVTMEVRPREAATVSRDRLAAMVEKG